MPYPWSGSTRIRAPPEGSGSQATRAEIVRESLRAAGAPRPAGLRHRRGRGLARFREIHRGIAEPAGAERDLHRDAQPARSDRRQPSRAVLRPAQLLLIGVAQEAAELPSLEIAPQRGAVERPPAAR